MDVLLDFAQENSTLLIGITIFIICSLIGRYADIRIKKRKGIIKDEVEDFEITFPTVETEETTVESDMTLDDLLSGENIPEEAPVITKPVENKVESKKVDLEKYEDLKEELRKFMMSENSVVDNDEDDFDTDITNVLNNNLENNTEEALKEFKDNIEKEMSNSSLDSDGLFVQVKHETN